MDKLKRIVKAILDWLTTQIWLLEPLPEPNIPPMEPTPPPRNLLNEFCKAIEEFEGYYKGSRSYRNNNSGNIRCTNKLYYGAIGRDDAGFCRFASYTDGFEALKTLVYNAASGQSQVYKPEMSILNFIKRYAPAEDSNHPESYATFIGKKLGVNPFQYQIKDLI